jgi:Poxvirus Late Transcription Factor VLTF3 like
MTKKNILELHMAILKSFEEEEKEIPLLERRIDGLEQCRLAHKDVVHQADALKHRVKTIRDRSNVYFYYLQATPILEEYRVEMSKSIPMSFMGTPKQVNNTRLDDIVSRYQRVVRQVSKDLVLPPSSSSSTSSSSSSTNECPHCKQHNAYVINSDNVCACEYCGTEQDVLFSVFSYRDAERINMSSKYQYDRRVHFKECINQFQGKQNSTIKPEVYEKLHAQLLIHRLDARRVTKKHISILLKEIGCSSHYEDLNLIYHNITGVALDNISHLEDILMDDFEKLSKLYDEEYIKTRKIERKNFINTQYVLFQLLRRHKYPCSHTDFSFLKTIERKEFHDDICSHLFKLLGWNFQPIF